MKLTLVLAFAATLSLVSLVLGLSFEYHASACYSIFAVAMAFTIFLRDYTRQRTSVGRRLTQNLLPYGDM